MRLLIFVFLASLVPTLVMADHHDHRHYEFIPNKGQENLLVNYSIKLKSGRLFIEDKSLTFHLRDNGALMDAHLGKGNGTGVIKGHAYKMNWVNAQKPSYTNFGKTKHYYNYFRGNDQSKWQGEVYAYEKIKINSIYPGIDVVMETNEDEKLEYSYFIAPGASPLQIIQHYEGIDNIRINKEGNLILVTNAGIVTENAPIAWQYVNGKKTAIKCRFQLKNNKVTYDLGDYDATLPLTIDPVLIFGSSSGSFADNFGMTATYDNDGNLYSGGTCFDTGFPTTVGAYDVTSNPTLGGVGAGYGITDVVLTKYAADGTYLIYSTYLGGGDDTKGTETVHSLIVNENDELMCFGATSSSDFPVTSGAYDNSHAGGSLIQFYYNGVYFNPAGTDIYVTKFNAAGSALIGSTLIGGTGNDGVNYKVTSGTYSSVAAYDSLTSNYGDQFRGEIMIDASDNIYVATTTRSLDFPMVNAFQSTFAGKQDAVIFKFDPNLTTLLFSTYLGGSQLDAGYSIKLDGAGNVFVTGGTASSDFPITPGVLYPTYQGGKADGFIAKLSNSGSSLLSSSYMGTNVYDQSIFVEIDKNDKVYLLGNTLGTGVFPIINAGYSNPNSGQFICRLDNNLTAFDFSTLFGNGDGTVNISPAAFLVDVCGNMYVSGWGANILQPIGLTGMPITPGAFQTSSGDGFNFYIACFQREMQGLLYGSYFGGGISHEHVDGGTSRFDKYGIIYQSVCAGCGGNDDFPTTPGAWSQVNNSTNCNNGVFKFDFEISPVADFVTDVFQGCLPFTVNFTNNSPPGQEYVWYFGNGDSTSTVFSPSVTYTVPGTYNVYLITEDSICGLIDTAAQVINVAEQTYVSTSNDTSMCASATLNLVADGNGSSNMFIWSSSPTFTDTLNSPLSDSSLTVNVMDDTVFYVQTNNVYCTSVDTIVINVDNLDPQISAMMYSCAGDSMMLTATNATSGEIYSIDWAPNSGILSGDGTPSIIINPPDTLTYSVTFSTPNCTETESYFVIPLTAGLAGATATADEYTITAGESTVLHANPTAPGYSYVWTPSSSLDNDTSANPVATPTVTTIYLLTISVGGCSRTDTVIVRIREFVCGDPYIYVPNAFTPNGDTKNDVLYVRGRNITEVYFAVFERWGEKVFETTDMNFGWDGKVNGKEADPAVFDYYLKVKCLDGEEFFQKGNVTLLR